MHLPWWVCNLKYDVLAIKAGNFDRNYIFIIKRQSNWTLSIELTKEPLFYLEILVAGGKFDCGNNDILKS